MDIRTEVKKMKADSPIMAALSLETRNRALEAAAKALVEKKENIFRANKEDMEAAEKAGLGQAVLKRLKFDEHKLEDVIKGIENLIRLPDPLSRIQLARELDQGLELYRVTCPIGVIGIIFEARPDALVQISSLCIKSGNCAVLKGGKETARTNKVLFNLIYEAVVGCGLPKGCSKVRSPSASGHLAPSDSSLFPHVRLLFLFPAFTLFSFSDCSTALPAGARCIFNQFS